jgi:hypothetical protein
LRLIVVTEEAATPTKREKPILASNYVNEQNLFAIRLFCSKMHGTNKVKREKLFNETSGIPILHYPQVFGAETGNSEELVLTELK